MRKIVKIGIISIFILLIYCTTSYGAEGTLRMLINGGTAWTNITVSQSYEQCEKLNSGASTLGTSLLRAHLTTDEDWNAMAIFSVSQYGATSSNYSTITTGNTNKSGIYNIGTNYTQTTGILSTANSTSTLYVSGLFNADGSVKPYMKQWSPTRKENSHEGFNGTYGWLGGNTNFGGNTAWPVSIKDGLFGVLIGAGTVGYYTSGGTFSNVTFRPVIWN